MWKFGIPLACARVSIAGTNCAQNSGFTWRAVSMRKPSTLNRSIHDPKMSIIPLTTRGFSVMMSSSPEKSPIVELSFMKIVSPRLW